VLAGHDHCYERLEIDGLTYVISGLGGRSIYSFGPAVEGSVVRYNDQYGVTVLDADALELQLSFFNVDGKLVDSTRLKAK
jgi:tartrate-resistant acid phosphatase type 5